MRTNPRIPGAPSRIAEREQKVAQSAALAQFASALDPDFIAKLKYDCLRNANARLRGASADDVVRAATHDFEGQVRFLMEARS